MFRPIRQSLIVLLALLPALLVVPAGVAAAQGHPNKPYVEDVDVTFEAPNLTAQCGFDVTAHVTGTLTIKAHPSRGDRVQFRYTHTFSGPGGSVSVNRVENAWITITEQEDGTEVEYVTASGRLMYHNVQPGHGVLSNNNGHEVFEVTWKQVGPGQWEEVGFVSHHDSGPNDGLSDGEFALICAQLG